jgi:predicted nucleic acid-binding protein
VPVRVALLDANVLIPAVTRDTLFRAAEAELYFPAWSEEILAEVERNLVGHGMVTVPRARRLIQIINTVFPDALTVGYDHLVTTLDNHPKDRHVLAAAIQAGAEFIVTENVSDFPDSSLERHGISAITVDEFLIQLLETAPATMHQIIRAQAVEITNPSLTYDDVLDNLEKFAPRYVVRMRVH